MAFFALMMVKMPISNSTNYQPLPDYVPGGFVSLDPIVTVSKISDETPMGFAPLLRGLASVPSLHFVGLTWSCESTRVAEQIRANLLRAIEILPLAHFIVMANTEAEAWLLSRLGVPNVLANELIFVDEQIYNLPKKATAPTYEASYVARLLPFKRHHLASNIDSLLLIYGQASEAEKQAVRELLPHAHFHNDASGNYRYCSGEEIAQMLATSATGLALSAEEGSMRAFMESLLCGIPVVTTPSRGGRARYAFEPYVVTVAPDKIEIARAVKKLVAADMKAEAIRASVRHHIEIERARFMMSLEAIFAATIGKVESIQNFQPFVGKAVAWSKSSAIVQELEGAG